MLPVENVRDGVRDYAHPVHLRRCTQPTPRIRGWSTYTVLGFVGYVVASGVGAALAIAWELSLGERLVALVAPPGAFLVTVTIATAMKGREWIVFYQAAFAAVAVVIGLGLAIGADVWRLLDVTVLGIGVFLGFGRLGCLHVGCCHGRPARRGVVYGPAHVAAGFWARWEGRPLVPVQLIESAATTVLVGVGLLVAAVPGRAAIAYATGYSVVRFALERGRGDPVRPYARGLSEAQWSSLAALAAGALAWPAAWTIGAAVVVGAAAVYLVATRRRRELVEPPHLRAVDRACEAVRADPRHARRDTPLGVAVTSHALPDGRLDYVLSSAHPAWSVALAERIARALWTDVEVIAGRTAGVVHVVVGRAAA